VINREKIIKILRQFVCFNHYSLSLMTTAHSHSIPAVNLSNRT
jgi:hypothetical protein